MEIHDSNPIRAQRDVFIDGTGPMTVLTTKYLTFFGLVTMALACSSCGGGGASAPVAPPAGPTSNPGSVPSSPGASTIVFSGYTWSVRNSTGQPGPNTFSPQNVWVDAQGFLHLKIAHTSAGWTTAEVFTTQSLGFGSYQFQIQGHPETLDDNVVLGFFPYTTPATGPDGTNEIDIEFATWGGQQTQHGNWTIWPAQLGPTRSTQSFDASLNTGLSTHRFTWGPNSVSFRAMAGLTDANVGQYAQWTFAPTNPTQAIAQVALPLHINLWLFNGNAPKDANEVEMVVTSFKFSP